MGKPLVYLVGPITGTTKAEHGNWRSLCRDRLAPEIDILSPLRQPFEIIDETSDLNASERLRLMEHGRGIVARDRFDVARCDLLIVNVRDARQISIGSVGEIFWADAYR